MPDLSKVPKQFSDVAHNVFHPKGYKQGIEDYSYIGNIQFIIQMHLLLQ